MQIKHRKLGQGGSFLLRGKEFLLLPQKCFLGVDHLSLTNSSVAIAKCDAKSAVKEDGGSWFLCFCFLSPCQQNVPLGKTRAFLSPVPGFDIRTMGKLAISNPLQWASSQICGCYCNWTSVGSRNFNKESVHLSVSKCFGNQSNDFYMGRNNAI